MIKRSGLNQFKRLKAPMMSLGMKGRRTERAASLAEKIGKNRLVEKCVWQDEKDFTLDVPMNPQNSRVYGLHSKSNI